MRAHWNPQSPTPESQPSIPSSQRPNPEPRIPNPESRIPSPESRAHSYEGMYVIGRPPVNSGAKMSVRAKPSISRPTGSPKK